VSSDSIALAVIFKLAHFPSIQPVVETDIEAQTREAMHSESGPPTEQRPERPESLRRKNQIAGNQNNIYDDIDRSVNAKRDEATHAAMRLNFQRSLIHIFIAKKLGKRKDAMGSRRLILTDHALSSYFALHTKYMNALIENCAKILAVERAVKPLSDATPI
jgi:hypothetical protein